MSDTLIAIIAIGTAAVIMFVFPLMTTADRTDDVTQLTVETATSEFTDTVRTTGKITQANYNKFLETINSTGNTYDVELEVQVQDENPGKKATLSTRDKTGENEYASVYTSQILESVNGDSKMYQLKEGDIVLVKVKNTNLTLSQQLKNFMYTVAGDDTYSIAASSGGMVTTTSKSGN